MPSDFTSRTGGDWAAQIRPRLASLDLHPAREAEIVEELSQHLDQRYDELRRGGAGDAEAQRLVLGELLEPAALAASMRTLRQARAAPPIAPGSPRGSMLADLWQDLRYAGRMLRKAPAFAVAAVLTLGLGIGANSAIFALVDAVLLRPLPFPAADRLVSVFDQTATSPRSQVSAASLREWTRRSRAFEALGGYFPAVGGMVTSGRDGTTDTVPRQWVTAGFFDVLGMRPVAGRTFLLDVPRAITLAIDLRVAAFSAAAALLAALLFGLAPAWHATGVSTVDSLASPRTMTDSGGRLRNALVSAQVATAVLVLFGAGLLLRTLLAVTSVDRGYGARSVLTMLVDPLDGGYPSLLQLYEAFEREVLSVPGVQQVAWATTLPMGRSYQGRLPFALAGDPPAPAGGQPTADYQIVSPAYFETVDVPIVRGRAFDERDNAGGIPVCIVNEAFAEKYLAGRSPLGVRVAVGDGTSDAREIVGVARQVRGRPDEAEDLVQVYVPLAQDTAGDVFMIVRPVSGRAETLLPPVRAALGRVDKEQLVSVRDVATLDDIAREATSRYRFRAVLVLGFGGLALVLAMVGVFGVLACAVQQRIREFGVRRALGASTYDVIRLVAGRAFRVVGAGVLLGVALSAVWGRLLSTMLFGVEPLDLVTLVWVLGTLALTGMLSAAGPAWRAVRVDPAITLRTE